MEMVGGNTRRCIDFCVQFNIKLQSRETKEKNMLEQMLRIKYSSPQLQSHRMHTFAERRIICKMKGEKKSKLSRTYKETPGPRERQNGFPVAGVLIYLFFAVSKQFSWAVRFEASCRKDPRANARGARVGTLICP